MLYNPCTDPKSVSSKKSWCDPSQPLSHRVNAMIGLMTRDEKIAALRDASAPIKSLDLPYYDWWNEATHGVATDIHGVRNTATEPFQTNFPFPITTGMAFNRSLWYATGGQIGREARAFMNQGNAFSTFWAPVASGTAPFSLRHHVEFCRPPFSPARTSSPLQRVICSCN